MSSQPKQFYEFGPFRLDPERPRLLRDGEPVPLTPKALEMLLVLVRNSGRVVEKDKLLEAVWPETFVEEGVLSVNINTLRKALGEASGERQYIETVPRRGYRFVAPVRKVEAESTGLAVTPHFESQIIADDETGDIVVEKRTRSQVVIEEELTDTPDEAVIALTSEPKALSAISALTRWSDWRPGRASLAIAALVIGAIVALPYFWTSRQAERRATGTVMKSVAVLPFKLINSGASDESLELGLTDALITRLSNLRQITVRPSSAALKYKGSEQDPVAAGRKLRVDAVLDGRVQRAGDRVRVTVQLVSVSDGRPLWAERFDTEFTNIFAVQDSISEQVARALALQLTRDEKRLLAKRHTANIEAYQHYLRGAYYMHQATPEGWKKSIEHFQQAIAKDPAYALPYTGLSISYNLLSGFGVLMPEEGMPKAREAAMKALELDETLTDAHLALAFVSWGYDWNWSRAEREFKRAIELSPTYAPNRNTYGHFLMSQGRIEEAIAESKLALELDPHDAAMVADLAWHYLIARQYDQAIEQCRHALEMDPSSHAPHLYLGWAYEQKGMYKEAIAELEKARDLSGSSTHIVAALGHAFAVSGRRSEALEAIDDLTQKAKQGYVSPYFRALIYAGLGETDRAIEDLRTAYEHRMAELVLLKMEPRFDRLRSDPRFIDLVRRIGLAP